ncbi:spindle assembly checkpoint kinase [Monosporozyma servazzii]
MSLPHRTNSSYQLNKKETLDQHKAVLSIISTSNSRISPSKRRNLKNTLNSRRYSKISASPNKFNIVSSSPSRSLSPVRKDLINNIYNNYKIPSRENSPIKPSHQIPSTNTTELAQHEKHTTNNLMDTKNSHSLTSTTLKIKSMNKDDFEFGLKLGKGKFGKVYCVREKKSGFICALKAMNKKDIEHYRLERQFIREVEIQSSLNHPNIAKLYGYFYDSKRVYMLMEFMPHGELYKLLETHGPFNDIIASSFVCQIADALDYLHQRRIIHRDIKPENILIGPNNQVKLTDFGWSIINPFGTRRKTLCGTIDYLSPELITSKEYDQTVDVWALGVLMYELLVGSPPFEESTKEMTYKRIMKVDIEFPQTMSLDAQNLIKRILSTDPRSRLSLRDIKRHPFILRNKEFW